MNQRAKPHAAPGTPSPAAGRAEWRRTGLKGSTGVHPRRGRRPIPRRGAGERGSEPLLQRPHPCSSPLTLRAAATRRLTVPGPRLRLLTLPSPPASAGLQLPVSRAAPTRAAPKPSAASAPSGRSQSRGRRFPGQRRPREPSAAEELAVGGQGVGLGDGAGRTGGDSSPSPCWREGAGGSGCRPAAVVRLGSDQSQGPDGAPCSRRRREPRGRRGGWWSGAEAAGVRR